MVESETRFRAKLLFYCMDTWLFWYLRKVFKTGSMILHKNIHFNYDLESLDFLLYLKR